MFGRTILGLDENIKDQEIWILVSHVLLTQVMWACKSQILIETTLKSLCALPSKRSTWRKKSIEFHIRGVFYTIEALTYGCGCHVASLCLTMYTWDQRNTLQGGSTQQYLESIVVCLKNRDLFVCFFPKIVKSVAEWWALLRYLTSKYWLECRYSTFLY